MAPDVEHRAQGHPPGPAKLCGLRRAAQSLSICHVGTGIRQDLEECRFVILLMSCCRNLTLIYINQPMVKLVSLYVALPLFREPIEDVRQT